MPLDPAMDLFVLVRRVVVANDVDVEAGRHLSVDLIQEPNPVVSGLFAASGPQSQ
jgi:hypothetical protein